MDDLAEAVRYLMREAPEQVPRLKALYREARQGLRRHPLAHAVLYDDYRRAVLVPFRYMVVYVTDGRSTDILAVLHAQRDPETLKTELRRRTFE
ncbi:MAG: type II toxin-antitoxin system RelE/ParE family toxin [Micrococcales bacterium]|nr:type II toxin-antitoxin system RelE/ParE family toxin [Micrococcales bacterium]